MTTEETITQEKFETLNPQQQVKLLLSEAYKIVKENPKAFMNGLLWREIGSLVNRHLGGIDSEKEAVAQRTTPTKKHRVINHTAESFNIPDKKKITASPVVDNYKNMNVDQLKELAKNEYGIDTRGITEASEVIYLIEQYKVVKEAGVKTDLEDKEITQPKVGDEEKISDEENDKGEETNTNIDKTLQDLDKE